MEQSISYELRFSQKMSTLTLALCGAFWITLGSLVKIPLYPVSFTLQTLVIYLLALTQKPKIAFSSALCYLLCGMVGLPVFCGHANPLWILGKSAGYLAAFPIAAYSIAQLRQTHSEIIALFCGMLIMFSLGFLGLLPFFGWQVALIKGVLIFIPSELLKILAALHYLKGGRR
jgi:biotin transport system substrate-specific component